MSIDQAPLRYFALVRDGIALDWLAVAPQLTPLPIDIDDQEPASGLDGEDPQPDLFYPDPVVDEGVSLVPIERGFDPQWESVDLASGMVSLDRDRLAAKLHGEIDAAYEAHVPVPGPVKSAEYSLKLAEAREVVAGGAPGPLLLAEAGDAAALDLAQSIIARATESAQAIAAAAAARREAKAAVLSADNPDAMRAAAAAYLDALRATP